MAPQLINSQSTVRLHFAISLPDGDVVDSNFDATPATFTMGDGSLLPGFEKKLQGMAAGDRNTFGIKPEDGFGQPNPANEQEFPRHQFAGITLEPGVVVSFADASKAELAGVVKAMTGDKVIVDFNHPLAGRELLFEVLIVEVL